MNPHRGDVATTFILGASIGLSILMILFMLAHDDRHWNGPSGKVTNKMWVQEFWRAGQQLYPARWCLELNYRDEVCIPESDWNKIAVGDWYGEK